MRYQNDDDDPYVEAEDEGDFVPSKIAPQPNVLPNYNPQLFRFQQQTSPLVSDTSFGVSVTPINPDAVVSLLLLIINNNFPRINFKISSYPSLYQEYFPQKPQKL